MAAKAAAPKGARGRPKGSKNKAGPRGIQLSAAQWKAYNKAFAATASLLRNRALRNSRATAFRHYRLGAAYATLRKYRAAQSLAQTAAIAAYATRRSWIQARSSIQNAGLRNRIELDMYNHANLAGRLQYAQAGVKAYAHLAVMRTVDQAQALAAQQQVNRKAVRTAKKAIKTTGTPLSRAITAQATQAGLAAARKVPKGRTAPAGWGTIAAAMAKTTTLAVGAPQAWLGDEVTPNCVVIAIANSLLQARNLRASEEKIQELAREVPENPTIEEVLWRAWEIGWPNVAQQYWVRLADYREVTDPAATEGRALVIGYATEHGDHAALYLPSKQVVSWGQVLDLEAPIEEAWRVQWQS